MVLAGAKSGIIFTIITLAVTVLVFVLAKVASAVKRGGGFDVVLKPIGLLDSHELRFNLSFENGSKKDRSLNDLSLAYILDSRKRDDEILSSSVENADFTGFFAIS